MIEVGEYVRTKKQGIKRIDTIFENRTVNRYGYEIGSEWDGKLYSTIKTTDIIKHSKNIIDLIEVGDYVNGYRILEIHEALAPDDERILDIGYGMAIFEDSIKTILTKEQYEDNCYKVKEE